MYTNTTGSVSTNRKRRKCAPADDFAAGGLETIIGLYPTGQFISHTTPSFSPNMTKFRRRISD